jgi:hypothetical protein
MKAKNFTILIASKLKVRRERDIPIGPKRFSLFLKHSLKTHNSCMAIIAR